MQAHGDFSQVSHSAWAQEGITGGDTESVQIWSTKSTKGNAAD